MRRVSARCGPHRALTAWHDGLAQTGTGRTRTWSLPEFGRLLTDAGFTASA